MGPILIGLGAIGVCNVAHARGRQVTFTLDFSKMNCCPSKERSSANAVADAPSWRCTSSFQYERHALSK
jgi:hypothetical protein